MPPLNAALEINTRRQICSVLFAEGGKQVLGGGDAGELRRWRVSDGQEVGEPVQMRRAMVRAAAQSPDGKWLVCGLHTSQDEEQIMVWNIQTREKALDVKGHTSYIYSVDISHDSSRFATGSNDKTAIIWDILTGQRLVGPLSHDGLLVAVRFSPDGNRIATGTMNASIRIYDGGNGQQLFSIPFRFHGCVSSPLSWSTDGRQIFAVSHGEVKCFDTSSGSVLDQWSVPGSSTTASIVVSRHSKFAVVVSDRLVSFWDISIGKQSGNTIQHAGYIWSIALSPKDDFIVTGEANGKITVRSLRGIILDSYFAVNLPFVSIDDTIFKLWTQGDLSRVEELLTEEIVDPSQCARVLAQRALVRSRLKQWDAAINDAKKSIELERSVIGYIASAVARAGKGEHEWALDVFDFVFSDGLSTESNLLLLIKAVLLFECGRHDHAVSRVDGIIDIVDNKSLYTPVRAQMSLLLGGALLRKGKVEEAIGLFQRARDVPVQLNPFLIVISLIFGWEFNKLDSAIKKHLQECIKPMTDLGDVAVQSGKPDEAIRHYSTGLSLLPPSPADILIKLSRAYGTLKSWEKALTKADEAIRADPGNAWGYEAKYVTLCGLGRHDEASGVFANMFTLVEGSADQTVRSIAKKYIAPSLLMNKVDRVIQEISKMSPVVLIDVKSGFLCDGPRRTFIFKSEGEFKGLCSAMTEKLDEERIRQVVAKYFEYVTFSHVWEGKEPSFRDVEKAGNVWELDPSFPLHVKLQNFCVAVRADGFRWAWSDTVCIDRMVSTVLNQSLKMMYLWYEASAATFVYLTDVGPLARTLGLKDSKWLTRAWTAQELLAPKVVRFYAQDWKPYHGDTRHNHKESPEIMQELVDAIGIARDTIVTFNPDRLSVRQKLRLASTRSATQEEDIAYSLIGIFRSDIRPDYGEGYAALGHLLEEIVARSGEVTVLDWIGRSSQYNSCLPTSLAVYSQSPGPSPTTSDTEMGARVAELRHLVSQMDALQLYNQITSLPPARFANRRLRLPCIIFGVCELSVQNPVHGQESRYQARVKGLGDVDFHTSDELPQTEAWKLVFVHPRIRDLRDPLDGLSWRNMTEDDESALSPLLHVTPSTLMDEYAQALRLVTRLQQPFRVLLLQQQSYGEFRRVAADHEIVVPGIRSGINFIKDVGTGVVEIL